MRCSERRSVAVAVYTVGSFYSFLLAGEFATPIHLTNR